MAEPFYDWFGLEFADSECRFLNYGYVDPHRPSVGRGAGGDADALHVELLQQVLREVATRDRRVLEIGCGRGGNCRFIAQNGAPAMTVGLDLGLTNVRFCSSDAGANRAAFVGGDAQVLPFAEGSFDVVLNLESSHCYADFGALLTEVDRVLSPGGIFCWADLWGLEVLDLDWEARESALHRSNLEIEVDGDLSEGVFLALRDPRGLPARLEAMAGEEMTAAAERLRRTIEICGRHLASGLCDYRMLHLRKANHEH